MIQEREKYPLYLIFITVLILRLLWIDNKNLWFDEIYSWNLSSDNLVSLIYRTASDIHPPLYYLLLKLWITIAGDTVFSMRLLSALFSSFSVFYIYALSRNILSRNESLIVIFFYAVSPLNLFYSQEVRMASMNLFLNVGAVYYLIRIIKTDDNSTGRNLRYHVFYLIFLLSAIYTHYISFAMLAAHMVFLIYKYRLNTGKYKRFILIYLITFIFYIPWLNIMISQVSRGQPWRSHQNLHQVLYENLNYIKDLNLGLYYHYADYNIVNIITYYLVFVYLLSSVMIMFRKQLQESEFNVILIVVPLILSCIVSFWQKIEFYRYLSILVPYILIFTVFSLGIMKKYLLYPVLLILFGVNVYGTILTYRFDFKNNDYRQIVKYADDNYKEGDRLYIEPHYYRWIADYYLREQGMRIKPVYINYGFNEILDSVKTQNPERFWLILDYGVQDTSLYVNYINTLSENYITEQVKIYNLAPNKAELYLFRKKADH